MSSHSLQDCEATEVAGFIAKTFQILQNDEFSKIAFWGHSGTQFVIKDTNKFQQIVLPRYFRHNKMNSFIRQLNMYGFHKSRTQHSKSVFSHPSFLKGRQDLLISIKRKIKGKNQKINSGFETPIKKKIEFENRSTAVKENTETGKDLHSNKVISFGDLGHFSFNLIGSKEKLPSKMNLNFSQNRLSGGEIAQLLNFEDENEQSHCPSIEDKIEGSRIEKVPSFKFMNPSCFFDSMK